MVALERCGDGGPELGAEWLCPLAAALVEVDDVGFAAVRGTAGATNLFGRALRLVQNGNLQTYAFLFVLGVAVVLWFVLGK